MRILSGKTFPKYVVVDVEQWLADNARPQPAKTAAGKTGQSQPAPAIDERA